MLTPCSATERGRPSITRSPFVRAHPEPWQRLELLRVGDLKAALLGGPDDGPPQRVLAELLGHCGEPYDLRLGQAVERNHVHKVGLAEG
jgi:hypothetical protein